ncbi:AraC family transcriptional regulator [Streptomyces sp. NPDC015492]|uniref:AraC family transcriptional regulator n=1 Tax=Streptomyces sp. NPDC015492 TaxID=3364958 RepID=UPI0036FCCB01
MSVNDTVPPVQRLTFSSRDVEETMEFLRGAYNDHRLQFGAVKGDARFDVVTASMGDVGVDRVTSAIDYRADADPFDYCHINTVRAGRLRLEAGGRETRAAASDSVLLPLGVPLTTDLCQSDLRVTRLPLHLAQAVAAETTGLDPAGLRFTSPEPVSSAQGEYWAALTLLIGDALATEPSVMDQPLLAAEARRALAVALLTTFPNTAMTRDYIPGPGALGPAALRRAVAHIDAHAHLPLTVADIATAAGTSTRALQYAFRRHHDTTPLGYARRVRLERAHAELLAADPADGTTVADVARRWGFAKPGNFTAAYRKQFHTLPSHTLSL